jgi:hypothetical protein
MVKIISHRAQGIRVYDVIQNAYKKNTTDNSQQAIEYFLNDFTRHHTDMIEVDVWGDGNALKVGHDFGIWVFSYGKWFNCENLILHCKNLEAVRILEQKSAQPAFDYFFHDADAMTFTKRGCMWVHPSIVEFSPKSIPDNAYLVMPNRSPSSLSNMAIDAALRSMGVCTDYPEEMDKLLNG